MANALITSINTAIDQNDIKRDIVDNFDKEEKILSIQIGKTINGNIKSFENSDKVVYDTLIALKNNIDNINPHNFKLNFIDRILGKNGQKLRLYFEKFNKNEKFLNEILNKLEEGKQILLRDNVALEIEAQKNDDIATTLKNKLTIAKEADLYLEEKIKNTTSSISDNIQKQILFPLKQKILDIGQQIAVHTQGKIAIKTLINNNKELINSVERTKSVTLNALNTAIITAQGLDQQGRILQTIQNINIQTGNLIAHTSKQLKEQGSKIQEGASNTMLNMETLKGAFDDVLSALNDTQNYKLQAITKMRENITLLNEYLNKIQDFNT